MTRLPGRRTLLLQLEDEIARAARFRRPLSLLFLDVQHFRRLTEQYGQAAVDGVLQRLAILLLSSAREGDTTARVADDRFALLLPETDAAGAVIVADRLRSEIAAMAFGEESGRPFRVSARTGAATLGPERAETTAALIAHAEASLQAAQNTDGDRGTGAAVRAAAFPEGSMPLRYNAGSGSPMTKGT